ncbi:MAG: superoxide dismutase [Anaerolineae bacterium]|nr:superoxide dismutase [Anaerolineae bacterium]
MAFELPPLPYDYDALEPHIDEATMRVHHDKHHAGYTNNLNSAIEGTEYAGLSIEDILGKGAENLPAAVRNNGGGFYNHSLFWQAMSPSGGGEPSGELATAISAAFGSFAAFKEVFEKAAATRFGSGWAWLVYNSGSLEVYSTPNQDNPVMDGKVPLLGLDVWEHAYYLKYQNRRPEYIGAWWNVVNWNYVSQLYAEAKS